MLEKQKTLKNAIKAAIILLPRFIDQKPLEYITIV